VHPLDDSPVIQLTQR